MTGFTEDELLVTIRRLLSEETPGVRVGPGDDAAVVDMGWQSAVLTADMLVEGVHFDRSTISARDLGYKAVVVNVSDVAAMGGSPRYGLVSLGLPPDAEVAWVVELYGGIRDAAAEYALSVVGGDTARADRVVVAVAVTGEVPKDAAVTRAGARPGDRIVVTGSLGAAAGGLHLSRAPASEIGSALTSAWGRDLLTAQFRPVARVGEGQTLAQRGATAMMPGRHPGGGGAVRDHRPRARPAVGPRPLGRRGLRAAGDAAATGREPSAGSASRAVRNAADRHRGDSGRGGAEGGRARRDGPAPGAEGVGPLWRLSASAPRSLAP